VALYTQSATLWFLPQFDASLANPRANPLPPYLALASDTTALPPFVFDGLDMGRGVFKSDKTVVLVPRAHILTEALMRITARDSRHGMLGDCSRSGVNYMSRYVEPRGRLNIDLLPEPFGNLYRIIASNDEDRPTIREILLRLMRACGVPVEPERYL
jgi:hypothetical protein